jgi:hypothetical protein
MTNMNHTEKRFFQTLLRENYVKPEDRGQDWQSSYDMRSELRRELEGPYEHEIEEEEEESFRERLKRAGLTAWEIARIQIARLGAQSTSEDHAGKVSIRL